MARKYNDLNSSLTDRSGYLLIKNHFGLVVALLKCKSYPTSYPQTILQITIRNTRKLLINNSINMLYESLV